MNKPQNSYCVYMHRNKTNGKLYIGITRQNPERRWQNGHGYDHTYFGNAILKYGWDSFDHEIISNGLTKKQACELEIHMIAKYKTNQREFGYNISEGGQTCDCVICKTGEDHPNHQRVKMIDPCTGEVVRIFGSQAEAARILGINRKGITKACLGIGVVTYRGYIWEYADKDYEKPGNPGVGNYKHDKIQKPIKMIDVDKSIHEYKSIKEAGSALGMRPNTIARYLSGIRKDHSGRRWCYV